MMKIQFSFPVVFLLFSVNLLPKTEAGISSQPPSSALEVDSAILKWADLYDYLFEDTNIALTGDRIKSALELMATLEITPGFKDAFKVSAPINEYSDRLTKYKLMEIGLRQRAVIERRETSLTQTLLETFKPTTNDCLSLYFARLSSIIRTFGGEKIYPVLRENREMKKQSCWFRFIGALDNVILLVGLEKIEILKNLRDQIEELAYNSRRDAANDSSEDQLEESRPRKRMKHYLAKRMYPKESNIYTRALAIFLHETQISSDWYQNDDTNLMTFDELQDFYHQFDISYRQLIWQPCTALIALAIRIMDDLNDFMTHVLATRRPYMTKDHFKTIDLTKMCSKILTNKSLQEDTKTKHQEMYGENLLLILEKRNKRLLETAQENESAIQSLLNQGPYVEPPNEENISNVEEIPSSPARPQPEEPITNQPSPIDNFPILESLTEIPSSSSHIPQPALAKPSTTSSQRRGRFYDSDSDSDSERLLKTFANDDRFKAYQIELEKLLSYKQPPKEPEQEPFLESSEFYLDNMPTSLDLAANPNPDGEQN